MTSPRTATALRTLALDAAALQAVRALGAAGIPAILLKGRAIAAWLYPHDLRDYRDVDLLVAPADRDRAQAVLADLGYRHPLRGASPAEYGPNEIDLVRRDGLCIDLHHTLIGCVAGADRCWLALRDRVTELPIAGHPVPVLDVPARAMHVALHAAQNGPADARAAEDLRRALAVLTDDVWREAATVARDAGAAEAFAAGLLLADRRLVARLDLAPPTRAEQRLRAASAGPRALALQRLLDTQGTAARTRFVARKLWPTTAYLRHRTQADSRAALARSRLAHLTSAPLVLCHALTERATARSRWN